MACLRPHSLSWADSVLGRIPGPTCASRSSAGVCGLRGCPGRLFRPRKPTGIRLWAQPPCERLPPGWRQAWLTLASEAPSAP